MARRPIWRGSLSFGLVQIPVGLFSAERANELDLDMLDKRDMARIGYQRINKTTGETVANDDIVKGYQYKKGEYVIVDADELKAASQARTETIDIAGFVDGATVDPVYFERPYYLAPSGRAPKAYVLLREVLRQSGKVGIATLVLRTRQHVAAIFVRGPALVLDFLRYADEIRDMDELDLPAETQKVNKKELQLAEQLVSGLAMQWDPTQFHDSYRDEVMRLIEKKAKTGKLEPVKTPRPKAAAGANIVELLRKSLAQGAANVDSERRPSRRKKSAGGARRRRKKTGGTGRRRKKAS